MKETFVKPICGCGAVLAGEKANVEGYQRRHIADSPEIEEIPWGRCPSCNEVQELGEPLPPPELAEPEVEPTEPTNEPTESGEGTGEGGEGSGEGTGEGSGED